MQLSDIRTRVRYYLREATANVWADAELTALINLAQRHVAARLDETHLSDLITAKTESYAASYTLPSDFIKIVGDPTVQTAAEGDHTIYPMVPINKYVEIRSYPSNHLMAAKKCSYISDSKLYLYPELGAGTVYYYYLQYPADLSLDADDSDLNDSVIDLVIIKAAADALIKTRQLQDSNLLLKQLESRIEMLNQKRDLIS